MVFNRCILTCTLLAALSNAVNGQSVPALMITGATEFAGSSPDAVELFATEDIPDLSVFTVERTKTGSTTPVGSLTFDPMFVAQGTFITVYDLAETTTFFNFFQKEPTIGHAFGDTDGDEVYTVATGGEIVDILGTFGAASIPWNFGNGWIYRNGCPSSVFNIEDWTVQPNAFAGCTTNADCPLPYPLESYTVPPSCYGTNPGSDGDPHFKTWNNEHYEYHGQCDLVLAKDDTFADGLGLNVQARTKIVRFWSYIKTAAIRIGNDILEVEGNADSNDRSFRYWINFEFQGELETFAGFPVTTKLNPPKNIVEIDLSSKFPGQKIVIGTFKEFIRVSFPNANEQAYGKVVGMLGDYQTGKTLGRDGATVLNDFTELGQEWQVQPGDGRLFRELDTPQFPAKCLEPEDPRGERRRRLLGDGGISVEAAEEACASLADEWDRKDCVYDILATQDLEMVGAF